MNWVLPEACSHGSRNSPPKLQSLTQTLACTLSRSVRPESGPGISGRVTWGGEGGGRGKREGRDREREGGRRGTGGREGGGRGRERGGRRWRLKSKLKKPPFTIRSEHLTFPLMAIKLCPPPPGPTSPVNCSRGESRRGEGDCYQASQGTCVAKPHLIPADTLSLLHVNNS